MTPERWKHSYERPFTTLLIVPIGALSFGGVSYIAFVLEETKRTAVVWIVWAAFSMLLWTLFFAIWQSEERGRMPLTARLVAWRIHYAVCIVVIFASVIGLVLPQNDFSTRVKAGAVLCGSLLGLSFIRPFLRR
jgi:hypothetical protein